MPSVAICRLLALISGLTATVLLISGCTGPCNPPPYVPTTSAWAVGESHEEPCGATSFARPGPVYGSLDADHSFWRLAGATGSRVTNPEAPLACTIVGNLSFTTGAACCPTPTPGVLGPNEASYGQYIAYIVDGLPRPARVTPLIDVTSGPMATQLPEGDPSTGGAFPVPCDAAPTGDIAFGGHIFQPTVPFPTGHEPNCHAYTTIVKKPYSAMLGYAPLAVVAPDGDETTLTRFQGQLYPGCA